MSEAHASRYGRTLGAGYCGAGFLGCSKYGRINEDNMFYAVIIKTWTDLLKKMRECEMKVG